MADIEWVPVTKFGNEPIGAVGFIGNDAVAVVSFFDDRDGNRDGKVSFGEWAVTKLWSVEGMAVTEVAMQARVQPSVIARDSSFGTMAMRLFMSFARDQISQGIYAVYFSRGVKMVGGKIAKRVTSSMVKEFVVRKGFESAVKNAFMDAVKSH